MKHSLRFWSRKSHCWAGLYLSALTLVWLGELAILPLFLQPELKTAAAAEPTAFVVSGPVSMGELLARFRSERANGTPLHPDAATFLPEQGVWVLRDSKHYVSITYDATNGSVRNRDFDTKSMLAEQAGLVWLSPKVGAALKFSFYPLFMLLCVTGLHLWLGRKR